MSSRDWQVSVQRITVISNAVALAHCAHWLGKLYDAPVYLCGSALAKDEPRDWDIRIWLTHERFKSRWGDPHRWMREGDSGEWTAVRWKWARENAALSKKGSKLSGLNLDVQIYPTCYWRTFDGLPRLLIA